MTLLINRRRTLHCLTRALVTVAALSLTAWTAAAAPAATEKPAAQPVTISAALEPPDTTAYVGEPVTVLVTMKNSTGKPLMILDWEHFESEVAVLAVVTGYPGEAGNTFKPENTWTMTDAMKGDYRQLPPGETVVRRSVTPMLPGKLNLAVTLISPADTWRAGTDGKERTWENGWKGRATAGLAVPVAAEMSADMKKRYDDVRRQLEDPLIPAEQKGRLLGIMGSEKHYFAARFLREFAEKQPAGPLRDAAVWQLAKLAKADTAYEAIPLLLRWMTDSGTKQEIRVSILDWAGAMLAGGATTFIADQAVYTWPEALQKQAREAIQKMTEDSNPYLASRAKDALRKLPG
jgi:hypothetical protein